MWILVTHLLQIKQILCAWCSLGYPVVIDLLRRQIVFVHQQHRCKKVKPAEGRDKFTAELMAEEHTQVDSPTGRCVPEWKGHWLSRERALWGWSGFVCEGVLLTAYLQRRAHCRFYRSLEERNGINFILGSQLREWRHVGSGYASGCPQRRIKSCRVNLPASTFQVAVHLSAAICAICIDALACLRCTVIWMQYIYLYIYWISFFIPLHSEA